MTTVEHFKAFEKTTEDLKPQFVKMLPGHVSVDKFLRVFLTLVQTSPDLLNVNRQSLFSAAYRAAQDGLVLDNREATLTIRKKKVSKRSEPDRYEQQALYLTMVGGVIKKMRNSGEISTISAHAVYTNDTFEYYIDEKGPHLKHYPYYDGDRGKLKLAYSAAQLKDGTTSIEVMSEAEIMKARKASSASEFGPWKDWPDEMWKKTVIKRHAKVLPSSTDIESVLRDDDDMADEIMEPVPTPEAEPVAPQASSPKPSGPSNLKKQLVNHAPTMPSVPKPKPDAPVAAVKTSTFKAEVIEQPPQDDTPMPESEHAQDDLPI